MILDEYVEIGIAAKNIKYYESLGYEIPRYKNKWGDLCVKRGTKIKVKISDLNPNSNAKIRVKCDFCGNITYKPYNAYLGIIQKHGTYACEKCKMIHAEATCMEKYGSKNPMQNKDVLNKAKQTNIKKYGNEWGLSSKNIRNKIEHTNLKKYGVKNVFQSDKIKENIKLSNLDKYGYEYISQVPCIKQKSNTTMYKNSSQKTSFQQQYIYCLLKEKYNVSLNYPLKHYSLDIFLNDYNIDIEVDGGGHDLSVKTGKKTQEEFNKQEMIREKQIRQSGIKLIRIVIPSDKLPCDKKILELISNAIKYFEQTNHTWINYYIEENKFINAENMKGSYLNYGELRYTRKVKRSIEKEVA